MDGHDLSALYRIRFPEQQLFRKNEIWRVLCRRYFQRYIRPSDTVVDVACGYGEFINNVAAGRRIAIDLNPEVPRFLEPGVEFHESPAMKLASVVGGCADVVFTSNFLEHLPDKKTLDAFLEQVFVTLRPGGRYVILGPNLRYLPGEYWDFYDHHLGLTHFSLMEALQLRRFEIEVCIDRFLPYTTQGALPTHPWLVELYLKFPVAWRILGKQFLVVARKPV
jgi:SAM-dependent methyltransferase